MRSGPSVTIVRTTGSSHKPTPASSVSRTCSSNESSSLVTQAIPPCAQAVFVSEPLRFVMTATEPCFAAFNAKLRPAMPLPITTKSYSFIPNGYCRSNEFSRKTPPTRAPSPVQPFQPFAKLSHRQLQHNRSEPAALHRLPAAYERRCLRRIFFCHSPHHIALCIKLLPAFVLPNSNIDSANCMPARRPPAL